MSTPGDFSTLTSDPAAKLEDDGFWAGGGPSEGSIGPWAAMKLNGQWFPGQSFLASPGVIPVFIDDGEKAYKEDKQKVRGQHGHRQIYNGYIAARFTVRCRIMTADQWAAFTAYLPQIDPEIRSGELAALAGKNHAAAAKTQAARAALAKVELQSLQQAGPARDDAEAQRLAALQGPGAPVDPAAAAKLAAQLQSAQAAAAAAAKAQRQAADKNSFSVEHPVLRAYRITRVDIIKVSFPKEADGRMVRDVSLLMQQITQLKDVGSRAVGNANKSYLVNVITEGRVSGATYATVDGQVSAEPRRP